MNDAQVREAILEFQGIAVKQQQPYDVGLDDVSLTLRPGELALVRVDEGYSCTPLADIAQGLLAAEDGLVRFAGKDWRDLGPDEANRLRAVMGRVFERYGWISNLDVDENVTLEQRNHTTRSDAEILDEAQALARDLKMDGLPAGRPGTVQRQVLRRAEWVRALLGQPQLILLERPTRDMDDEWTGILAARVNACRQQGAAVVWLTDEEPEWRNAAINPTLKFRMRGSKMAPVAPGDR